MARYGQRYVLNLRPYESYTRYWEPLDNPAHAGGRPKDRDYFRPMADGSDPDDQHGLHNIRGNGRWVLEPDLAAKECRRVFYDDAGVALHAEDGVGPNLHPAAAGRNAWVVFKVSAANVITSLRIEADGLRTGAATTRCECWSPGTPASTGRRSGKRKGPARSKSGSRCGTRWPE